MLHFLVLKGLKKLALNLQQLLTLIIAHDRMAPRTPLLDPYIY